MATGDQTHYLVNNVTSTGTQPPNAQAGPPLPLGGQQPGAGATNMAGNLVTNVTTPNGGPRQITSLADLMGVGGAPGAGQMYSYSPEQLQEIIKEYENIKQELMVAARDGQYLAAVKPPAKEDASRGYAQKANSAGQAFLQANQQAVDYVQGEINKLTAALQQYNQAEEVNSEQAKRIYRNR